MRRRKGEEEETSARDGQMNERVTERCGGGEEREAMKGGVITQRVIDMAGYCKRENAPLSPQAEP